MGLSAITGPDEAYQELILPDVSRTFALTIPQLPPALRGPVTCAYLLCRIADTIEDEPGLSPAETLSFLNRFKAVVSGGAEAALLARDLVPSLTHETSAAERELVTHMDRVIRVLHRIEPKARAAMSRCVQLMCDGMPQFQLSASLEGLTSTTDLDDYCYYVAGVVGEMLVDLFCSYSTDIARQREPLYELATSFAEGLQMTNILKDQWEDRARGACWLPRDVFVRHGLDLATLHAGQESPAYAAALAELIGVAHAHLRNALAFTLMIPPRETGIRKFCLWAIGMAVLTLRKIHENPGFASGRQVKIPRRAVTVTRLLTGAMLGNNWLLRNLFDLAARGLPLATPADAHLRSPARIQAAMSTDDARVSGLSVPRRLNPENAMERAPLRSGGN
jgi:farnesyl-diphosphate farnesyltransferase